MESGKIDIDTDVKGSKEPVATYKSIPEDDSVPAVKETAKEEEANMTKHNGDTDIEDPAQELMLKDSTKINSSKDTREVTSLSENGDAKIDIEAEKSTLTGMTKEELMKFANDPFWIRLRWFMFLAFWILWAAMLAGAIAIIVMAPKCTAPEPRKLWEVSPIVQLQPKAENGLKGLIPILKQLKDKNVRVISIGVIKGSLTGHTTDFRDVDPELGNIEDFKNLIKAAKEQDQEIVLEIDPNHTSDKHGWFNESSQGTDPEKKNYYVWQEAKKSGGEIQPPNDWVSVNGASAWEWNDKREQYYLHQFNVDQPDLNYENPAVVKELSRILEHWMSLGVFGFRIAHSQYLIENLAGGDEKVESAIDRSRLPHVYTRNLVNNSLVLQEWRKKISNHTANKGLMSLQEDTGSDTLIVLNDNFTVIDLPQQTQFLSSAYENISASALKEGIDKNLNKAKDWPAWNFIDPEMPLNTRVSNKTAESLTLMTLLLPGTPILSLAQTEYPGEAFATLTKARSEPSFLYGNVLTNVTDGTVFLYTRLKSGNPGYLVAYQSGSNSTVLDLSKFDKVPDEVIITALSSNYNETGTAVKDRISSTKVPISAKSTLVVQFAPQ